MVSTAGSNTGGGGAAKRAMAAKAGVRPSQSSEPSESSESGGEPEERVAVEAEAYLYDAAKSHISEEGG